MEEYIGIIRRNVKLKIIKELYILFSSFLLDEFLWIYIQIVEGGLIKIKLLKMKFLTWL